MKKIIERIVASESAPGNYDLWVDTKSETPELKVNYGLDQNNGWKTIGGSGSSDSNVKKVNMGPDVNDVLDMMAEKEYFTIEAIENGTKVYFKRHVDSDGDPVTLSVEISTDGETWTEKNSDRTPGTLLTTLNAGQKLYIRGNNATYGSKDDDDYPNGSSIYGDKDFYAYGNMMSLVEGENALKGIYSTTLGTYTFACFFKDTKVCSHPTKNLILPAKSLKNYSYARMFYSCTKLIKAPDIFATGWGGTNQVQYMFYGCTLLEVPPKVLHISTDTAFYNCPKLKRSPILLNNDISSYSFSNCPNVSEIINLGTMIGQYSTTDWSSGSTREWHCPAETGVIYKLPDVEAWNEITLPDGWVLKDVEIVYE